MNPIRTYMQPFYVGEYIVNTNLHFSFSKKPSYTHRFFTWLFLGWKWVDYEH